MHWFTGFMLYVVVWWLVLFTVLPFGTRPIAEANQIPGGFRGVPARPLLWRKVLVTTIVAAAIWGGCAAAIWGGCIAVIRSDVLSFRHGVLATSDH